MKLTKLLSLLLALMMVFALVGCGDSDRDDDDDDDDKKDSKPSTSQSADDDEDDDLPPVKDSDDEDDRDSQKDDDDRDSKDGDIEGTWVAKVDMLDLMEASGQEIPDAAKQIDGYIEMTFEFDGDEVTLSLDTGNAKKALKKLMEEVLVATLEEQYDASIDEIEEELGMTIDELVEEQAGMSMDDYVDTLVETMQERFDDMEKTADYEFDGETLTIDGEETDCELDGDTLVIDVPNFGEIEFERD